jgi:hypothetical protein
MISHGTSRIYFYFKICILLHLRALEVLERIDSLFNCTCNPVEHLLKSFPPSISSYTSNNSGTTERIMIKPDIREFY